MKSQKRKKLNFFFKGPQALAVTKLWGEEVMDASSGVSEGEPSRGDRTWGSKEGQGLISWGSGDVGAVTSASHMGGTGEPKTLREERGPALTTDRTRGQRWSGTLETPRRGQAGKCFLRLGKSGSQRDGGHRGGWQRQGHCSQSLGHRLRPPGRETPRPPRNRNGANAPRRPRGNIIARQKVNYEIRKQ